MQNEFKKFFDLLDKEVANAKDRIKIADNYDAFDKINQALIKNPSWLAYYNNKYSLLCRIKTTKDHEYLIIRAKLFSKIKVSIDGGKVPSDSFVNSQIDIKEEVIMCKKLCNKLGYYEQALRSIINSFHAQLKALQTLSTNLRKELH